MKNKLLLAIIVLLCFNKISAQQNVGINVITPAYPLDIRGFTFPGSFVIHAESQGNGSGIYARIDNAAFASLPLESALRGEAVFNNGVSGVTLSGNAIAGWAETGKGVYASSLGGRALDAISASDGTAGYFYSAAGLGLIVEKGNVGLGVTNPYHQLEMQGTLAIASTSSRYGMIRFRTPDAGDSASYITANQTYFSIACEPFGFKPQTGLWINRTNNNLEPFDDNLTDIGTASYHFKDIYAMNGVIQTSDLRMKKNITNLNYGLATVMKLRPVAYDWKMQPDGANRQLGFIAQEMEAVVPEAVVHDQVTDQQRAEATAAGKPVSALTDPYGMKYNELIPVLTKAIQEQQQKIEQLEKELQLLKRQQTKR